MASKHTIESEMIWHDDGHKVSLRINKSELEVTSVYCPMKDDRKCRHEEADCVVEYFVLRYGMECNAGVCSASDTLEICWTYLGEQRYIDMGQVWFMPKTDEMFSAWLIAKKNA